MTACAGRVESPADVTAPTVVIRTTGTSPPQGATVSFARQRPRPAVPGRPRIDALLNAGEGLTVLLGPHGAGKTTAVDSWLATVPSEVARLHVMVTGADVAPAVAPDATPAVGAAGDTVSAELRTRLDAIPTDTPAVVVLDDSPAALDAGVAATVLELLEARSSLRAVVCARGPHPVVDAAAGRLAITVISADELALTADETRAAVHDVGPQLSDAVASELHGATAGWPQAVRSLAADLVLAEPTTAFASARAVEWVLDHVVPTIDPRAVPALARLSLADELTHRLIRAVTGSSDEADLVIAALTASGLGERHYLSDDANVVLHPIVRESLRRLAAGDPSAELTAVHRRLAQWFARQSSSQSALRALSHTVHGEHWDLFDDIWYRRAMQLYSEDPAAVLDVLQQVPPAVLADRAGLKLALAETAVIVRWRGDDPAVPPVGPALPPSFYRDLIDLDGADLADLAPNDLLHVGVARICGLRAAGRLDDAENVGAAVSAMLVPAAGAAAGTGGRLAYFLLQRARTALLRNELAAAAELADAAWAHRATTPPRVQAAIAGAVALTSAVRGDPKQTRRYLAQHAALAAVGGRSNAHAELAGALLALDELDDRELERRLSSVAAAGGPGEMWPVQVYVTAQHTTLDSNAAAGLARLDAEVSLHGGERGESHLRNILLTRARSDLLLATGDVRGARDAVRHLKDAGPALGLCRARVDLHNGELRSAALGLRAVARAGLTPRELSEHAVLEAHLTAQLGDAKQVAPAIDRAIVIYHSVGIPRAFTLIPAHERDALFAAATVRPRAELARRLKRHRGAGGTSLPALSLTKRERVLVQELARLSSRQEIADTLFVSVNTVRAQLHTLYSKLGVGSREAALEQLRQRGLLD